MFKIAYVNVHSSIIYNTPKSEAIWGYYKYSFTGERISLVVVYLHHRILFSNKKEQIMGTNSIEDTLKYYTE